MWKVMDYSVNFFLYVIFFKFFENLNIYEVCVWVGGIVE